MRAQLDNFVQQGAGPRTAAQTSHVMQGVGIVKGAAEGNYRDKRIGKDRQPNAQPGNWVVFWQV